MRRRRAPESERDHLLGVELPPFIDDFTLPIRVRVDRYEAWMSEHYAPLQARRDEYEERTGHLLDPLPVPDAPFDLSSI